MCLITEQKHPIIAQEDIVCYKVVRQEKHKFLWFKWFDIVSPFLEFKYKLNKLYKTELGIHICCNYNILECPIKKYSIDKGFHSITSHEKALIYREIFIFPELLSIVKCIIPKGSELYKESNETYLVSNQIIIKEVL